MEAAAQESVRADAPVPPRDSEESRLLPELAGHAPLIGDESGFAARQLPPKIATGAELIVTMTCAHRDAVLKVTPSELRLTFATFAPREVSRLDFGEERARPCRSGNAAPTSGR